METVDEEFSLPHSTSWIERPKRAAHGSADMNTTRMHIFTHLEALIGRQDRTSVVYPDGMVELDGYVGQLLKKLDDLGVADNTIVVFTTDNGAEVMSWPDGGARHFAAKRTPTGKAAGVCPASCVGLASSSPDVSSTTSVRCRISFRPSRPRRRARSRR